MNFTKKDAILAGLIGFFVAVFLQIVIKNLELELPVSKYWLFVVFPILSPLGLYLSYAVSVAWKPFVYQFGKFFIVGGLNTFIDLGVLNLLILLTDITHGFYFAAFKGISFACAVVNSFFWNKLWTFQKQGKFLLFFVVVLGSALLNVGWASYLVDVVGAPAGMSAKVWDNIAALSSVVLVLTWNFLGMKYIVFKKNLSA